MLSSESKSFSFYSSNWKVLTVCNDIAMGELKKKSYIVCVHNFPVLYLIARVPVLLFNRPFDVKAINEPLTNLKIGINRAWNSIRNSNAGWPEESKFADSNGHNSQKEYFCTMFVNVKRVWLSFYQINKLMPTVKNIDLSPK